MYRTGAPRARANSRIPFTELWSSAVSRNPRFGPNGYDSPTSLRAAVALAVKITMYSSGDAERKSRTARRAEPAIAVAAREAGLFECGLPRVAAPRRS